MFTSVTAPLLALITALSLLPLDACAPPVQSQESTAIIGSPDGESIVAEAVPREYGVPLPPGEWVNDDWFEDTAFIGHSLIQGFAGYSGLTQPDYYYLGGVSVSALLSSSRVNLPGGGTGKLSTGLSKQTYEKVYLMMGINEVAGNRADLKADYLSLINTVRSYNPEADIYVLAVLPVTYNKSSAGTFTIARIQAYNEMLLELCGEEKCWYVDLYACYANENGYLPSSASYDGIHLNHEQYIVMLDYLRTHTAKTE